MNSRRGRLLACALGAAAVPAFAPFDLAPLAPLSLALLFAAWRRAASARAAAWLGACWGLGFFLAGVSWVYVSMHDVGSLPAPLAALATLAFCAYLALFPAAAGWLARRLDCGKPWRDALLFAGAWTALEWLRGWLFTGFPWLALGYSQAPPSPLAGYAAVLGVYGVGYVAAFSAALLALARASSALPIAALLLGGQALLGVGWTEPVGAPLEVALLQGNIDQNQKWEAENLSLSLDAYMHLARSHPAELTVLPETSLPLFLHELPESYLAALTAHGPALAGVVIGSDGNYYNAAVALEGGRVKAAYAKSHLVPFGEYTPPGFSWFMDLLRIPMSDFSPGAAQPPPLALAGQRIAANICFEDLFGEEIIRTLPQATLLINLSNTAWFGASWAQPQHLQIARMRALETGRMMLRATNTGMTAVLRPDGSVQAQLPPFAGGVLRATVQGYAGMTPFARWGNALALALAVLSLVPAGWPRLRESR